MDQEPQAFSFMETHPQAGILLWEYFRLVDF